MTAEKALREEHLDGKSEDGDNQSALCYFVTSLLKSFFRENRLFRLFIGKSPKNSGTGER
jgi:hypothetical protein